MKEYPLKFYPILKEKIWGGNKLKSLLNKESLSECLGESWEVSCVEDNVSLVKNGFYAKKPLSGLINEYNVDLVGSKVYDVFGNTFPLLLKFIDANKDLSVQLHPNDELAKERHNSFGKNEMWYVVQSDKDAKLITGFKKNINESIYQESIQNGNIIDLLRIEEVTKGDSFFIETGTIHAIGEGSLIAEVQQTSDITYRVFDWNRKDSKGKERELHNELALKAINYKTVESNRIKYDHGDSVSNMISNQYFKTNYIHVNKRTIRNFCNLDSFKVYMCVNGKGSISVNSNKEFVSCGETVLIPAISKEVVLEGVEMSLLEVYIEN
jgi:mannose-6-phosphate isomerase